MICVFISAYRISVILIFFETLNFKFIHMITVILLAALVLLVIWAINIYNKLVSKRNMVEEGWSSIDVQLKRRSDLIPSLISTTKAYMQHEEGLFRNLAELRSKSMSARLVNEQSKTETELSRSLGQLFALAENYPDLKANQNFLHMQQQLSELEDHIQMARRYYNGSVRNYNIQVESFPDSVIASSFNFTKRDFFELENLADRELPKVDYSN